MVNKIIYFTLTLGIAMLLGCSWQESFIVRNNTEKKVRIFYKINFIKNHEFAIFEPIPTIYKLTANGNINWKEKVALIDNDTSLLHISVMLPPHTALLFGSLSNDEYISADQEFINGRNFNFNQMMIKTKEGITEISLKEFDSFFKKEKNIIKYDVQ